MASARIVQAFASARAARIFSSTPGPATRAAATGQQRRLVHALRPTGAVLAGPQPPSDSDVFVEPQDPSVGPVPDAPSASSAATPFAAAGKPKTGIDWSASFHGLSVEPFAEEVAAKLMAPLDPEDVEIKPDGIIYLPEIKYRRILNAAFGPGGWGLAPRSELAVGDKIVSREFALVVQGRFVGQARGECPYFGPDTVATAGEGCKSNALMRCSKDLGIASELWDPRFIRQFKQQYCREVWVEHVLTKKRRQIWLRKDCPPAYPYVLPAAKR